MAGARVISGVIAASLAETDARVSLPQLRVLAVTADRGALTVGDVAEVLGVGRAYWPTEDLMPEKAMHDECRTEVPGRR